MFKKAISGGGDFRQYLKKEKIVASHVEKSIKDKRDAIKYFGVWGELEHDDIKDVSSKMTRLISRQLDAENDLNTSMGEYRQKMREIKVREKAIADQEAKVAKASSKLQDALRKQKDSENLKFELQLQEDELKKLKADHEGFKRRDLRDSFYTYFKACSEFSRKLSAVANFGKHLADQIPQGTLAIGQVLPAFTSGKVTEQILKDFDASFEGRTITLTSSTPLGNNVPAMSKPTNAAPAMPEPKSTLSTPVPPNKLSLDKRVSALSLSSHVTQDTTTASSSVVSDVSSQPQPGASFIDRYSVGEKRDFEYATVSRPIYGASYHDPNASSYSTVSTSQPPVNNMAPPSSVGYANPPSYGYDNYYGTMNGHYSMQPHTSQHVPVARSSVNGDSAVGSNGYYPDPNNPPPVTHPPHIAGPSYMSQGGYPQGQMPQQQQQPTLQNPPMYYNHYAQHPMQQPQQPMGPPSGAGGYGGYYSSAPGPQP
ncbi:Eisosome component PIL1-domain-containing protein [Chytridium lagenaria]|nr:Eisosome component PIL1-domain-containing protein [Chytridium lagenaria]